MSCIGKAPKKASIHMFEKMKEFSEIIFTSKKSRMIIFLLIIVLSINGVHSSWPREHAVQGQFNYVVSIQKSNSHLCTGTIIDETHVLTIGHLFIGAFLGELSVIAGTVRVEPESVHPIKVKKVHVHPLLGKIIISGSLGEDWENDIAILELNERFQWGTNYGPVHRTIIGFDWLTCPICTMITWSEHKTKPTQIWTIVLHLDPKDCSEQRIHIGENQQCFIDESYQLLITSADLGGPIVCGDTMVGFVAKKQMHSEQGKPSTFLETVEYSEFIHDVLIKGLIDVLPREFPYVVSIWFGNSYICGGSILGEAHILTAADCVQGKDTAKLKVVAGVTEASEAQAKISHLSVRDIKTNDDIAILVLAKPILTELTLRPLDYLNTKDASPGLFCDSLLWKDEPDSKVLNLKKLRKARVRISTKKICKKVLEFQGMTLPADQFCAKNQYSIKVTDFEDSGNPLICEEKLVGILLKASPLRSPLAEAVFLEIDSYKQFITSTIAGQVTPAQDEPIISNSD